MKRSSAECSGHPLKIAKNNPNTQTNKNSNQKQKTYTQSNKHKTLSKSKHTQTQHKQKHKNQQQKHKHNTNTQQSQKDIVAYTDIVQDEVECWIQPGDVESADDHAAVAAGHRVAPYPTQARPRGPHLATTAKANAPMTPPPTRALINHSVEMAVQKAMMAFPLPPAAVAPAETPLSDQIAIAVKAALTVQNAGHGGCSSASSSGNASSPPLSEQIAIAVQEALTLAAPTPSPGLFDNSPGKDAIHATFTIQDTPNVCSKHFI
jgi:hypothetical protein